MCVCLCVISHVAQLWQARMNHASKDPESETNLCEVPHLIDKHPADSAMKVEYNFKDNISLRDMYIDTSGNILM